MNQKLKEKINRILIICAARYLHCINPRDHHHPHSPGPADAVSGRGRLPYYRNGILHPGSGYGYDAHWRKGRCAAGQGKKLPVIVIACVIIGAMVTVPNRTCRSWPDRHRQCRTWCSSCSGCRSRFLPGTCISSLPLRLEPFPHSSGLLHHSLHPGLLYSR